MHIKFKVGDKVIAQPWYGEVFKITHISGDWIATKNVNSNGNPSSLTTHSSYFSKSTCNETIFKRGDVIKNSRLPGKTFIIDSLVVKDPFGHIATEALESVIHRFQVHDKNMNRFDLDPQYCSHVRESEDTSKMEVKDLSSDHKLDCNVGNHEESKTAISLEEKHFKQWIVCKHCGEAIRPLVVKNKPVKIKWDGL